MSLKQAADILLAAYQAEVEYRHRRFIEDKATKTNIERLAAFLIRDDAKFGVMLCGVPGNGKTTLLYAFQSAVNWLNDIGHFEGKRAGIRIVDAKEVVMLAKDFEAFRNLRNPVGDMLEYRYNMQLFTFITTNLTKSQIREKYGNRIADRFNEMLEVIIFKNETYRDK